MLSSSCALMENWRLGDHGWKVFLIAGHDFGKGGRGKKTYGAQLWNYLHNCKVKAILRGGQQRALCLGSAFWPRRNTICCHPPLLHPAFWADYDSGAGWAECRSSAMSHTSIHTCCCWFLAFTRRAREETKLMKTLWGQWTHLMNAQRISPSVYII